MNSPIAVGALGALCVAVSAAASSTLPAYITAAVANPKRPAADAQRDAHRRFFAAHALRALIRHALVALTGRQGVAVNRTQAAAARRRAALQVRHISAHR